MAESRVNMTLMRSLVERYGKTRGEAMYWKQVGAAEGPFAPGRKYHDEHLRFARDHGLEPVTKGNK